MRFPRLVLATAMGLSLPTAASGESVAVSVAMDGEPVAAWQPSLSNNGRFVAFTSVSPDIVPGDTNHLTGPGNGEDVFVRDRRRCVTKRISVSSKGNEANEDSSYPVISANGRFVAFVSQASNLVRGVIGHERRNVFLHDRRRRRTELINVRTDGTPAGGVDFIAPIAISATGRYVAFSSDAGGLVAESTMLNWDGTDVYVRDRKRGITRRVSITDEGAPAVGESVLGTMSANGKWIVFGSTARLERTDADDEFDVYLTSLIPGTTRRINLVGESKVHPWNAGVSLAAISDNGCIIAFGMLGRPGIAVYDCERGSTVVEIDVGDAQPPAVSGDGRYIAFRASAGEAGPAAGVYAFDRHTRTFKLLAHTDALLPPFMDLSRDGSVFAVRSSDSVAVQVYGGRPRVPTACESPQEALSAP